MDGFDAPNTSQYLIVNTIFHDFPNCNGIKLPQKIVPHFQTDLYLWGMRVAGKKIHKTGVARHFRSAEDYLKVYTMLYELLVYIKRISRRARHDQQWWVMCWVLIRSLHIWSFFRWFVNVGTVSPCRLEVIRFILVLWSFSASWLPGAPSRYPFGGLYPKNKLNQGGFSVNHWVYPREKQTEL
jgi:hypothetical protein